MAPTQTGSPSHQQVFFHIIYSQKHVYIHLYYKYWNNCEGPRLDLILIFGSFELGHVWDMVKWKKRIEGKRKLEYLFNSVKG